MCLIVCAIEMHPDYPFILCANRDEFHKRPTQEAHFWEENERIFAGKDLEKGGSWLGVTVDGRLAAVTNIRRGYIEKGNFRSRGEIVANFLNSDQDLDSYVKEMKNLDHAYQGYNAIVGLGKKYVYFSNDIKASTILTKGIHGLSNASLNTSWPKTDQVKLVLGQLLQQQINEQELIKALVDHFYTQTIYDDEILPHTGVEIELERRLSPIFINGNEYGTRATTIILQNNNGELTFFEQTYKENGVAGNRVAVKLYEK